MILPRGGLAWFWAALGGGALVVGTVQLIAERGKIVEILFDYWI